MVGDRANPIQHRVDRRTLLRLRGAIANIARQIKTHAAPARMQGLHRRPPQAMRIRPAMKHKNQRAGAPRAINLGASDKIGMRVHRGERAAWLESLRSGLAQRRPSERNGLRLHEGLAQRVQQCEALRVRGRGTEHVMVGPDHDRDLRGLAQPRRDQGRVLAHLDDAG